MPVDYATEQVMEIIRESFGGSPMPYLTDPAARRRAMEIASAQGLPERIAADLEDGRDIPIVPYTRFRDYQRNGNRTRCERYQRGRARQIELAAMACLLGIDKLDYLHDLMWAECESTWWVMAAHERHGTPIDLRSAMTACKLATVLTALGGRIDPEVRRRVAEEIGRRVLGPNLDPAHRHWWKTCTNNWNAVCIANVAIAAMLLERDRDRLAATVADAMEGIPHFLEGFCHDGGCTEGPSYWRFGFGWFIRLAAALFDYTGGRIRLAEGELIGRICRYPLSVALAPGQELTFADAQEGSQEPATAILINRFHDVPELLGMCQLAGDGALAVDSVEALLLYDGRRHEPFRGRGDHLLSDLGVALVRSGPLAVGAKAGHNAEHHNHNDVGSFIVFRDGAKYLTDPGAPVYSADTFSSRRYESLFCNSLGHSVPVIAGRQQPPGRQYAGSIAVEGLNASDLAMKAIRIEMAGAYDVPSLKHLVRVLELAAGGTELLLRDTFSFEGPPQPVEEGFITAHAVEVAADGRSAAIRPEGAPPARLSAAPDTPGRFSLTEFVEESRAESRTGELIRRLAFHPPAANQEFGLRFVLRFGA